MFISKYLAMKTGIRLEVDSSVYVIDILEHELWNDTRNRWC